MIEFATLFLGITLYPWQRWLLIHALELNEDGTYRFRKVFVIVGRQNGKTTLLTVLALWWLFVDSESFPEHVSAREFVVLGTAQNLDVAEESWTSALARCNPRPAPEEEHLAVPVLQSRSRVPVKVNGKKSLRLKSGARYEPRAASRKAGRGRTAARIIMDEMREQQTWDVWGSVSKTKNAVYNNQLWGISSAGDAKSIVLRTLRDRQVAAIESWLAYVETGLRSLEEHANEHDLDTALFEWSADPDAPKDDLAGILQSNPSCGHRPMMLATIMSDLRDDPDDVFRTEVLCQWVNVVRDAYLDASKWVDAADRESEPAEDSRIVFGVDVEEDRSSTAVSIAGYRDDGRVHIEAITERAGILWLVDYLTEVQTAQGFGTLEVAVQPRGCPASELVEPLRKAGFIVHEVGGTALGAACGQTADRLRDDHVRHLDQEPMNIAAGGAVVRKLGDVRVWDRPESPVKVATLIAASNAAWALENTEAPETFVSAYETRGLMVVR